MNAFRVLTTPSSPLSSERRYLEESIAIPPAEVAKDVRGLVRHTDATHWVQWDESRAVSEAIVEFLDQDVGSS